LGAPALVVTLHACVTPAAQSDLFARTFAPEEGLGPLYNGRSCSECHNVPSLGGVGVDGLAVVFRVGFVDATGFTDLAGRGGPVARNHSIIELGYECREGAGIPRSANVVSTRNTPPLFGLARIDEIPDQVIVDEARPKGDGVSGRPNWVMEGNVRRVGRFGWKAHGATLRRFVAEALRTEMGITNPDFPDDLVNASEAAGCAGFSSSIEVGADTVTSIHAFVAGLAPPAPDRTDAFEGRSVFSKTGCDACHVQTLPTPSGPIDLYSDLLLHDMGAALKDGFVQYDATSPDWRTTPLWGLRWRSHYLHDGRATTLDEAVRAHDGEAHAAASAFASLQPGDRDALLRFLGSL
jgi:CxxC motif-containing protein (DUF1111 family)